MEELSMELKFDEVGRLVMPPQKPVLDKTGWVRMTRKRWAKIKAHEEALEKFEEDMKKYESIPVCTKVGMEARIELYKQRGKLLRNDEFIVLFDVSSKDTALEQRIEENREFFAILRKKAEEKKRKEGVQLTLDGVVRYTQPVRVIPLPIIKSFGILPNVWLEKAWLESIWYGKPLTDWQSYQIGKREKAFEGGW